MEKIVFGIDFDDTYTADPDLWKMFCDAALARGHSIRIVTCRRDTAENRADLEAITGLPQWRHILTGLAPKRWFCEERGIKISIWIDDMPESILHGR